MPRLPSYIPRQCTTVRITTDTRRMLSELRKGEEPLGEVVRSALLELKATQKKVKALEEELWKKTAVESPTMDMIMERYKL